MKILPILFNTEMVQAILDDRKTVTRRILKFLNGRNPTWTGYIPDGAVLYGSNNVPAAKAPYRTGDILYVRETWYKDAGRYMYRADYSDTEKFYIDGQEIKLRWYPSIHMPKEAARIFLQVTNVRAERLQEIDEQGAIAEGCSSGHFETKGGPWGVEDDPDEWTARDDFCRVWDSTVKPAERDRYGWPANPWVWVTEFLRCKKPEGIT